MKLTNILIYSSHFLSCWGNRMWQFGMGMFLVRIANDTIQLSATFGLVSGLAVFFFGAMVGDWIDNTRRLKAAQISLVLQDVLMFGCAILVTSYLAFKDTISSSNTWLLTLLQALFVTFGVLSGLAAQARIIAVERDWIVEICGQDKDYLASMTAMLRRIDQVSMILAPMATGQVMTYLGLIYGAIFISGWNMVSVFIEFYLTWKVYNTVPALKAKKDACRNDDTAAEETIELESGTKQTPDNIKGSTSGPENKGAANGYAKGSGDKDSCLVRASRSRFLYQFVTLYRGGRIYTSYRVALAGLALAFLYMTVLDFHNITVAYAITQGLSESVVGILQGSSAVFGIVGTFAYPVIRRYTGLHRTGFIALSAQVSSLALCIVSIWMPGSPFDPFYENTKHIPAHCGTGNASDIAIQDLNNSTLLASTVTYLTTEPGLNVTGMDFINSTDAIGTCGDLTEKSPDSYLSVIFLMAGVFLGRFGVWVADLTITQLFLEKIIPTQRGIVNGVQSSINQLMDLLKYALVVALPDTETFGFLIIISFCSIATGWVLYTIFILREGVTLCICCDNGKPSNSNGKEQQAKQDMIKFHPDPQVGKYVADENITA